MAKRIVLALIGVLAATAAANAGTIYSPAIFGSHGQNQATCVVLNTGPDVLSVTVRFLNESGGIEKSGTVIIGPGQFAVSTHNISFGVAYACSATSSGSSNLRGALTIIDIVPDGFGGSLHRPIRSADLR